MAHLGYSSDGGLELHEARYAASTVKRYKAAVGDFALWLAATGEDCDTLSELDALVDRYIHILYRRDRAKSPQAAVNLRYGLTMLLPELKRPGLPRADLAIAGWRKMQPGKSYPPIPHVAVVAAAAWLVVSGEFRAGVAVLLGFECYLRAGELVRLRREDVGFPDQARVKGEIHEPFLRLQRTKTGREQSVSVRDRAVRRLLRVLVRETKSEGLLFPYSPQRLRKLFKEACDDLGLGDCGFVLHSLRHGGATRDYCSGALRLEDVMLRGRWESSKTVRRYIQRGRALLLANAIPEELSDLVTVLEQAGLDKSLLDLRSDASDDAGVSDTSRRRVRREMA